MPNPPDYQTIRLPDHSPFVVGRPLRANEPIFGREDALRFIADQLVHYSSINIVGDRDAGDWPEVG